MPKNIIDYSKTKIYKLVCKDIHITKIYIGHTTNWIKRKSNHKSNCNNSNLKEYDYFVYQFIRENGGWDNFDMILIEEYECENRLQAEQRERYWIETLKAELNTHIPSRTQNEYYETNKETVLEYQKQYYETNKETFLGYQKKYYEKNKEKKLKKMCEKIVCECGCEITKCNMLRHRRTIKHLNYSANIIINFFRKYIIKK